MAGAADKLLGNITLNGKPAIDEIKKVNDALKKLGEGESLDLTKVLNKAVANQIAS